MLMAVLSATACHARKVYEMNAMVTPKRDTPNVIDPYLKENFLALRETNYEEEEDGVPGHILGDIAAALTGNDPSNIVSTSDIDNYFNLQITT